MRGVWFCHEENKDFFTTWAAHLPLLSKSLFTWEMSKWENHKCLVVCKGPKQGLITMDWLQYDRAMIQVHLKFHLFHKLHSLCCGLNLNTYNSRANQWNWKNTTGPHWIYIPHSSSKRSWLSSPLNHNFLVNFPIEQELTYTKWNSSSYLQFLKNIGKRQQNSTLW
jgi:hypothetical protein